MHVLPECLVDNNRCPVEQPVLWSCSQVSGSVIRLEAYGCTMRRCLLSGCVFYASLRSASVLVSGAVQYGYVYLLNWDHL